MRIESVFISEYKNLKNFTLDFDTNSFLEVFVGKNGTGKSNFFEALVEIFRHLYEFDKSSEVLAFNYRLAFVIEEREMLIEYKDAELRINRRVRKSVGKTPLPDNVLIYYSGHNDTVNNLVENYEQQFKRSIRRADVEDSRRFIGIGSEYKEILLAVLLLQNDQNLAKQFILEKLAIKDIAPEIKMVLKRPDYAISSSKSFDMDDANSPEQRYWMPEGITKNFLDRLSNCITYGAESPVRTEGYLSEFDQYIIYFGIEQIQNEFSDLTSQDFFRMLDNLKTLGMLDEVSILVTLQTGKEADISYFSDGQFQSVYIYTIMELLKDRNCVTLLDEPDSFLHPEWQYEFLKQVFDITENTTKKNHVLISSHSAVTLIPHDSPKIKFFDINDNQVNCYSLPKRIAVRSLSSNVIRYSEIDQILSIINTIQIENKPVLFTEGSTDPIILTEAWKKLYHEEIPFIPFYAFSCGYIKQLLTDNQIHTEMQGLPIFGLFDFDKAYDQWNDLNGDEVNIDPYTGMIKRWAHGEAYALMIPIPNNEDIKNQVIQNLDTNETFGGQSSCEIEHIFYGYDSTANYFKSVPTPGGSKIAFVSDSKKTEFAKEVIPALNDECFEAFRPLFDFIKSKCVPIELNNGSEEIVSAEAS